MLSSLLYPSPPMVSRRAGPGVMGMGELAMSLACYNVDPAPLLDSAVELALVLWMRMSQP